MYPKDRSIELKNDSFVWSEYNHIIEQSLYDNLVLLNLKRFREKFDKSTIDKPLESFTSNQILYWIDLCLEPTKHFLPIDERL